MTDEQIGGAERAATDRGAFLESLMETELYSIGAYFSDEHPELVDELVKRSEAIERDGLAAWSAAGEARSKRRSRRC